MNNKNKFKTIEIPLDGQKIKTPENTPKKTGRYDRVYINRVKISSADDDNEKKSLVHSSDIKENKEQEANPERV